MYLLVELLFIACAVVVVLCAIDSHAQRVRKRLNAIEDRIARLQVQQDDGIQEIIDYLHSQQQKGSDHERYIQRVP